MAVSLLANEVSDLCLGKPALKSLPISVTVGDALSALTKCGDSFLSVWSCDHRPSAAIDKKKINDCRCVGKICMVDVICYLCEDENLRDPTSALKSPVSVLLPKVHGIVRHVEPHSSLLDALDLILSGAQNLVIPIESYNNSRKKLLKNQNIFSLQHASGREFCCLTQEDFVRFFLNSIGLFSPLPALSIESLNIIRTDVLAVGYDEPAASAINAISQALSEQTSVAVVTADGKFVGEISPSTIAACDETVAAAIATLSAGDLMAYIDCGGPPKDIVRAVKARLRARDMEGMLELLGESSSTFSSSSDDDDSGEFVFPEKPIRYSKFRSYSARMVRRAEGIVCHPGSSLVAVMIQALSHRVNYVWVVEDDYSLAGIVTFSDVLKVFWEHLQ